MSIVNSNNFLHKTVDGVKQFFSPLVNAATVVLQDGTRLEKDGKIHTDTADDSKKLDGKDSVYFLQPRNLLDNSDFTNPVNQRGLTTYATTGSDRYTIDRWIALKNTAVYVLGDRIEIAPQASSGRGARQIVNNAARYAGKTLTAAVKIKNLSNQSGLYLNDGTETGISITAPGIYVVTKVIADDVSSLVVQIGANGTTDADRIGIEWIALYEGEYTADNLPPYVYKGYAAELAECQRYYEVFDSMKDALPFGVGYFSASNTFVRVGIQFKEKRIIPTITFDNTQSGIVCNGAYLGISSYSVTAGNTAATITNTTSSNGTAKMPAIFYLNGKLVVSADL